MELPKTLSERFWRKVTKKADNECWMWVGGTKGQAHNRYGCILYGRKNIKKRAYSLIGAHQASYLLHYGEIKKGLFVCHKCDNKLCVNPNHLFLGTAKDNVQDMLNKGRNRQPSGENHRSAKITYAQMLEIKEKVNNGERAIVLAQQYGLKVRSIYNIKLGTRWCKRTRADDNDKRIKND